MLGKSMRYILENTTTSFTTLAKELDYIETYLTIQKLRFHDKINYSLKSNTEFDLDEYQIIKSAKASDISSRPWNVSAMW